MANGFSSDPRRPIPPAADASAAGARLSVLGSWIEADSDLELVRKRALHEALGAEQDRLRSELELAEERLGALDAQMHLALARDHEAEARGIIRRIIALRRRSRELENGIASIGHERTRLAAAARAREAGALRFPPPHPHRMASRPAGSSAPFVSSGAPTSRPWIRRAGGPKPARPASPHGGARRSPGRH